MQGLPRVLLRGFQLAQLCPGNVARGALEPGQSDRGEYEEYIEEHYRQKGLTIHEIAKNNHVSELFELSVQKYTGGPVGVCREARMEES